MSAWGFWLAMVLFIVVTILMIMGMAILLTLYLVVMTAPGFWLVRRMRWPVWLVTPLAAAPTTIVGAIFAGPVGALGGLIAGATMGAVGSLVLNSERGPAGSGGMTDPYAVHTIVETPLASPAEGIVRWDAGHSLWNGGMMLATLVLGPMTFSWGAFGVFVVLTGGFPLLGHSVGFHRRLIHGSFKAPKWLDYFLMWCGTMVGMSGPFWMIRAHDLRDWAQRQKNCHAYLAHKRPMLVDGVWQLHFRLELANPPAFDLGDIGRDRFYRFLERTWMLQQLPLAAGLYLAGGLGFVVWGVCARVFISVFGHWFVGHLAHNRGPQSFLVEGAGVQAHDVPWAAIPTMGEAWHNNHHAYPGSARIGLKPGQADWGFRFIQLLERLGLAWDIRTPESLPERVEVHACASPA